MAKSFIFFDSWLDSLSGLPLEIQEKAIADIVRYGTDRPLLHENDTVVSALVNFTKGQIDNSKEKYAAKLANGQTFGRTKKINDREVWLLAREGKTASAIAASLGVCKATIDHCKGWKCRKDDDFSE